MVRQLVQRVTGSGFVRSVAVLATGNLIAQAIPFLMLPIYARLFGPEMFALQSLLMVGMLTIVPMATGWYEFAIPSPKHPREARAIATIAAALPLGASLMALLIISLFKPELANWFNINGLGNWIYAYPLLIFANALCGVSNYWLLRKGQFKMQSANRIMLTACAAMIAVTLGVFGITEGLLYGLTGGMVISAVWAQWQARRSGFRPEFHLPFGYFLRVMKRYREFPLFGGFPSALNNLAAQVPLLIITAHYSLATTGHYAVARGLLSSGAGLLSAVMGQVLLKQITDRMHRGVPLWPYFRYVSSWIAVMGLALCLGTYILGPWFFTLYLGPNWADSADIIRILSANLLFWLLAPTMAMAVVAIKKLRILALWQVTYLAMASSLVLFGDLPFNAFMHRIVGIEVVAYGLYYAMAAWAIYRYDHPQKAAQTLT
ncbi:MAG: lipopolysaccharide biosynthesis protein [Rickettsiales bacterium]